MEEVIQKRSFWSKNWWWMVVLGIVLVLVVVFYVFVTSGREVIRSVVNNTPKGVPSCPSDNSVFTHTPVMLDDFTSLIPLGNMDPSPHVFPTDHIYFHPEYDNETGINEEVNVYAMGDMWITSIISSQNTINGEVLHTDYSIDFSPCKEISGYFIHMTTLSEKLQNAFDENKGSCNNSSTGGRDYESCQARVEVKVSAGEKIATAGGLKTQGAFDLGMLDYRIEPLYHINESRWKSEKHKYTVCPFDQFVSPLREELMATFSDMNGNPIVGKDDVCGRIDFDIAGTAQGAWFTKGFKGFSPEDTHLALAPHNYEVGKQTFSIGQSVGGVEADTYLFTPQDSGIVDLDFSKVVPGKTYCYELTAYENRYDPANQKATSFAMHIYMPDEETLHIEKAAATNCNGDVYALGPNFVEFER